MSDRQSSGVLKDVRSQLSSTHQYNHSKAVVIRQVVRIIKSLEMKTLAVGYLSQGFSINAKFRYPPGCRIAVYAFRIS